MEACVVHVRRERCGAPGATYAGSALNAMRLHVAGIATATSANQEESGTRRRLTGTAGAVLAVPLSLGAFERWRRCAESLIASGLARSG